MSPLSLETIPAETGLEEWRVEDFLGVLGSYSIQISRLPPNSEILSSMNCEPASFTLIPNEAGTERYYKTRVQTSGCIWNNLGLDLLSWYNYERSPFLS